MKYKVGKKVHIKKDLVAGKYCGEFVFIDEMKEYLDKEAVITEILSYGAYRISLDNGSWKWTDEMIEDTAIKKSPLTNGDLVRVIKSTLSVAKKKFIGKEYKIKDVRSDKYPYRLEGIDFYWFNVEELELVEVPTIPSEELKNTDGNWLGKQYEILYFRGGKYREGMELNKNILTAKGTLVNFDTPFTGRFFLENENGALEIIPMQSVVEMREVV